MPGHMHVYPPPSVKDENDRTARARVLVRLIVQAFARRNGWQAEQIDDVVGMLGL